MEKVMYPLWKMAQQDADSFARMLLQELAPQLLELGARGLRLSIVDSEVATAQHLRQQNCQPLMDAMLSLWLDSAVLREPFDAAIRARVADMSAYLVTESEPLRSNTEPGQRTPGMTQVVFLQRPQRLSEKQWLEIWQGSHTQVAIDTQSTFGYRQNVVVRALSDNAMPFDAIVEENFPAAAMTSMHAFYGVDTDAQLQANVKAMIDSCTRFIDFDKLDVIPTSEYLLKAAVSQP